MSVNLLLHPTLTLEQDDIPKPHYILQLLQLGQKLRPNLKGAIHTFPAANYGLRVGGHDSHPSRFTLGCKLFQCMMEVTVLLMSVTPWATPEKDGVQPPSQGVWLQRQCWKGAQRNLIGIAPPPAPSSLEGIYSTSLGQLCAAMDQT